jgi:hypothetical protein
MASASAMAQSFDINLSNDAAMLTYMSPLGQQGFGHGQVEGSVLFNDNDDFLGDVGFGVVGAAGSGSPGLTVGVGAKLYGVNASNNDIAAVALGGRFDYAPPPLPRLRFGGEINIAPSIVTFIDGDRLSAVSIYLGYDNIKVNIQDGGDVTVDSGSYLGVKFKF